MKRKLILLTLLLLTKLVLAQTYDSLKKLEGIQQNVYYSAMAKERAVKILDDLAKAEIYFETEFNVLPKYTLLVLGPSDWKIYAHPNAIYGIPHYLPNGDLMIVASENNDYWKRNIPPLDQLPEAFAQEFKSVYTNEIGEMTITDFMDLLVVHELGHAFQKAAGMKSQRNWLSELLCNILLHTFITEQIPTSLPALTLFPQAIIAAFPPDGLKYTKLEDFDTYYNDLAQNHPDNYGWYQSHFHITAGQIYDSGGAAVMKNLWDTLLDQKEKHNDEELMILLKNTHPALEQAFASWNK